MKRLSVVVSVYNEEEVLTQFYEKLCLIKEQIRWDYEVIFVNDGSTDKSEDILQAIASTDEQIKCIFFSRNFGHEAAMLAGIDHSTGDGVICMDADLQHPLTCIPEIIDRFESGYEVINMVRSANKSAGLIKNMASKLFYKVINVLSAENTFEENASDFFAISRKVVEILKHNYREKTRFLRGYIQSVGFRKTTLSYVAADRAGGQSHYSLQKLWRFSVSAIICFSDFPLKIGVSAGVFSALLGMAVLIYTLLTYQGAPSGYATIVVLICFLFASQFLITGIIGQYIAILFSETKDRPIYIIEKMLNIGEKGNTKK